jgi:hypothetical protein
MIENDLHACEVKQEVYDAYQEILDRKMETLVWARDFGQCTSSGSGYPLLRPAKVSRTTRTRMDDLQSTTHSKHMSKFGLLYCADLTCSQVLQNDRKS